MAKFFLHYVLAGVCVKDLEGHELDGVSAAMREAVLGLRSIQGGRLVAGLPLQEGRVEIADADGRRLAQVTCREAVWPASGGD